MPNKPTDADPKVGPAKTITLGRSAKTSVTISIYPATGGRYVAILYGADGKRVRKERASIALAEEAARAYVIKHVSPEAKEKSLLESKAASIVEPSDLLVACSEYAEATEMLRPLQATLLEAVRFYVKKRREDFASVSAATAVDHYLGLNRGRQKTQKVNKTYLTRIKKDWGSKILTDVDHVYINAWIGTFDIGERSKRNYYDAASLLFRHAKTNGWFPLERQSPTKAASRPDAEQTAVETYTPEEGLSLLVTAKNMKSPAYPVIAMIGWSGCRTEEIAPEFDDKGRLGWERILWAEDEHVEDAEEDETTRKHENQIYMDQDAAKRTRRKSLWRYMPLLPNLATILAPFRTTKGSIYPLGSSPISKEFDRIAKKAGIPWKRNALRHSFGTYRYAILREVGKLADEMGNSPAMIREYYTKPMPTSVAKRWFKISV
jgi:hypothetical protein